MFSLARKALVQVIMTVRAPFYVFLSAVVLRRCWSGSPPVSYTHLKPEKRSGNLLVDIQAKLRAGKGAGYARWATDRKSVV